MISVLNLVGTHLPTLQHHPQHDMGHRANAPHSNAFPLPIDVRGAASQEEQISGDRFMSLFGIKKASNQ